MDNREFQARRVELAHAMAAAGAELLEHTGTAAAMAAIPHTTPQQYVVAGTLPMIAKVLPASAVEQPAGDLTDERALFEAWARDTNQGYKSLKGAENLLSPDFRWYYFDVETNDAWGVWKARAAIAAYLARKAQAKPVAKGTEE